MRINTIAFEVGYLSARSFIQVFKENTGMTPGQFRQRLLQDENMQEICGRYN